MKALNLLNWFERLVCAIVFVAAAWSVCIGFALTQPGSMQTLESVFPHLHLHSYAVQLQPHSLQLIIVGAIVASLALALGVWLLDATMTASRQAHGSARFANWFEIWRAGYAEWSWKPRFILGHSGFQTIALTTRRLREHVIAIAPSGQGKTSEVILPNLLQERGDRGLLSNDPKGEQYEKCVGVLSQRMMVVAFAPSRLDISVHYNPLMFIASMTDAENFATAWVENTSRGRSRANVFL